MDDQKNKIEKEIENFKNGVNDLNELFKDTKFKLVLDDSSELDVSEAIKGLDAELRELNKEAEELIAEMDAFKLSTGGADFNMCPAEIRKTIRDFKDRLKEIKQHQIDKYNARVEATNKMIDELRMKDLSALSPEIVSMFQGLETLDLCDVNVRSWTDFKYLEQLDYNKLVEMSKKVVDVCTKIGVMVNDYLESEISSEEKKYEKFDKLVSENMTKEDVLLVKDAVEIAHGRLTEIETKLVNNKENISEEKYNEYLSKINLLRENFVSLDDKLRKTVVGEKNYDELRDKLNSLNNELLHDSNLVDSLYGGIIESAAENLNNRLVTFENRLNVIKKEIEDKKDKLDENQYNQLIKKVEEIEKTLEETRSKLNEPEMVKDVDVFAFLNGRISGLETAIAELNKQIEGLEKPIRDKEVRKNIDKKIARLEKEAKNIEKDLERYKEENPQKYNEAKERLDKVNEKLNQASKEYRRNCPLFVRTVKSAKNFFKKHKKLALIIAGLAAIALIHATVGPILIPAIMHGNIMIGSTTPALRGFIKFANNILGGIIGATRDINGAWYLANGVMINPSVASTSLLKGLAISGIGNAVMLTPMIAGLVVAIKKLVEKMKVVNLKEKLKLENDNLRKKLNEKLKAKKKTNKPKNNVKFEKEFAKFAKLFQEYRKQKPPVSLDEFCLQNNLSESDKAILQTFEAKFPKDNVEAKGNSRS